MKEIYHFFDQNVIDKMTKIDQKQIQRNIEQTFLKPNIKQALTSFSLLEFAGIQIKDIFNNIFYKGKKLSEYPFKYEELQEIPQNLKKQLKEKVSKEILKEKLIEKKNRESRYLNSRGIIIIDEYIKSYVDDNYFYKNLIHNLYLDRLPEINISNFSQQERDDFNKIHLYPAILRNICDRKRTVGAFRAIKKMDEDICQKIRRQEPKNTNLNENRKKLTKYLDNLKLRSNSDLVDLELIHLSCFGYDGHHCLCYTTDDESIIRQRLDFYLTGVLLIEYWFYEYLPKKRSDWENYRKKYLPSERPDWKCGRIFILNKNTGEKIKIIPVRKIYDKIKKMY